MNDAAPAAACSTSGNDPATRRIGRARLLDRFEECGQRQQADALRARVPRSPAIRESTADSLEARSGKAPFLTMNCAVSDVAASSCATFAASLDGWRRARRSSPMGVNASRARPRRCDRIRGPAGPRSAYRSVRKCCRSLSAAGGNCSIVAYDGRGRRVREGQNRSPVPDMALGFRLWALGKPKV